MKTIGATRKKPSQSAPGSAQKNVVHPELRWPRASGSAPSAFSFGSCSSASASSSSPSASRSEVCGSGTEELDIVLLPRDPDVLALAAAQERIALARHLGEHPLAADLQMQLHEVAEELDEHDPRVDRVVTGRP